MKTHKLIFLVAGILFFATIFLFCESAIFASPETPLELIMDSIDVLEEMDSSLDSGMFRSVLSKAKGVAIFPSLTEVALLGVGGFRGNGLVLRRDTATSTWYGPAFLKISSLGIGARVGIQSIDLVLVINDSSGLEAFMKKTFKLGGTLAITVGPIGRSVSAEIDTDLAAPIYSYSITKGLYFDAGSFQGSTIKDFSTANESFWGVGLSNRTILEQKIVNNSDVLKLCDFIENIGK